MKISDVIEALERHRAKYGDAPVCSYCAGRSTEVRVMTAGVFPSPDEEGVWYDEGEGEKQTVVSIW